MKKSIVLTVVLALLASFIAPALIRPQSVEALSGGEFVSGNIISDSIFFNSSSVSADQIQNFLNSKVPFCDTNGSKMYSSSQTRSQYGASKGYPAPYTCLKSYAQNTPDRVAENGLCKAYVGGFKSSAQIISDVSAACGVNPQVLLVLLQKEQSLVTDEWPWAKQYDKATGFGCPDTPQGCDPAYAGFFYQVYSAARQFKKYARDSTLYNYRAGRNNTIYYQADNPDTATNERADCGAGNVYIQGQATAGLYVYTPYQPNKPALYNLYGSGDGCSAYGNRNFWRMFNDWFGNTQGSFLVRTPNDPTYFLLTAGKKYAIPSGDILYAYGIENQRVDVVSNSYLSSISDGGMLSTLFTIPGDPTVYLADGGKKHGISSGEYCVRWGLKCGDPAFEKVIGDELYNRLGQGGMLQQIMRHGDSYYLMENGLKKHFLSMKSLADRGYSASGSTTVLNWTNAIRTFGTSLPENDSFVKYASGGAIYLYTGGSYFAIPSFNVFNNWFPAKKVSYLDTTSSYNTTPPVSTLLDDIVNVNNERYLIDRGKKVLLTNDKTNWPTGISGTGLTSMLGRMDTSATASGITDYRLSNGAIYRIVDGEKRAYYSVYDYLNARVGPLVQLGAEELNLPDGSPIIAERSGYKVVGSDAIYLVGKDSKSYGFTSVKQIRDFKTNQPIPLIQPSQATQFNYQGALRGRITTSNGTVYIISDGEKHLLSGDSAAVWGFAQTSFSPLSDTSISNIPLGKAASTFFGAPNGTIFKAEGGTKRPIGSYNRYILLGGNQNNTLSVSQDVIDDIPQGPLLP